MGFPRLFMNACCSFHTSSVYFKQVNKLPKVMNKILSSSATKRKWHPDNTVRETLPSIKSFGNTKFEKGKSSKRRVEVLNKLFMRHITDQMSCGDIATKLSGSSIEISRVKISPDFNILNVFWLSTGTSNDEATEDILKTVAGILRYELSNLRVIGNVPKLHFVKDRSAAKVMELEIALAKADYGEDFVPTDSSHSLKSELLLNTRLEPHLLEKIKQLDGSEEVEEVTIPAMSQNIYGLDRLSIVNRINSAKEKSIQAWNRPITHTYSNTSSIEGYQVPLPDRDSNNETFRRAQFQEFLKKRKVSAQKAKRLNKIDTVPKVDNIIEDVEEYNDDIDFNEYYDDENYDDLQQYK